jgi:hypothetical protein
MDCVFLVHHPFCLIGYASATTLLRVENDDKMRGTPCADPAWNVYLRGGHIGRATTSTA